MDPLLLATYSASPTSDIIAHIFLVSIGWKILKIREDSGPEEEHLECCVR